MTPDNLDDSASGPPRNPRGILTRKDREVICLVATARYLSTDQACRLVWPNQDESVGRRRLYALAGLPMKDRSGARLVSRPVFDPPYLRRLRFRAPSSGARVDLWAITLHGHAFAVQQLRADRKLMREDVAAAFLEHSMALTDLFVVLAAPYIAAGVTVAELPFQWDPIDARQLPWEEYDSQALKVRSRRIVPDAILTLTSAQRRYFVECEMGTHSIIAASDEKAGATLSKTERYNEFFAGNFYAQSFPDRWPAEVLYLVRTDGRMDSVNAALDAWRHGRTGLAVRARARTLAAVENELRALLPPVPQSPVVATRRPRALTVTKHEAEDLKRFYQDSLLQLEAYRREFHRSLAPDYLELAGRVRPILARLCGPLRPQSQGGTR